MRVHALLSSSLTLAVVLAFAASTARAEEDTSAVERELAEAVIPVASSTETPAGHDAPIPVIKEEGASGVSLTVSTSLESGRIFQDQAFHLTGRPVGVVDFYFKHEPTGGYLDLWAANNGHSEDREEDVIIGKVGPFGAKGSYDGHIGWYELPGKEVWDFKLTLSHPISDRCGITAYGEVMRGGFRDHVGHVEIGCSQAIGNGWSVDGNVGPSYTTSSDVVAWGYEAGLSYQFPKGPSVRGFVKGYTSPIGSEAIVGIGPSWSFANIFGRK